MQRPMGGACLEGAAPCINGHWHWRRQLAVEHRPVLMHAGICIALLGSVLLGVAVGGSLLGVLQLRRRSGLLLLQEEVHGGCLLLLLN